MAGGWRIAGVPGVLLLALTGCAAAAPAPAPGPAPAGAALEPASRQTADGFFRLDWTLQGAGDAVRAAGVIRSTGPRVSDATLLLVGVDAGGRIRSRAQTVVRWGFGTGAQPFEVRLRPRGGETRYELQVWQHSAEGLRGGGR
jgi:hypothetical protein